VQRAVNRGESYHQLRRTISYANAGKFRVKTETEQHIWNECSRLIANAVIYYNTLLLSRVYAQKQAAGDHAAADIVKDISPNAWQHVHLIGGLISSRLNRKSTSMRSRRVMTTQTSGIGP